MLLKILSFASFFYHYAFNYQLLERFVGGMPGGRANFWFHYSGRTDGNNITELN